MCEIASHAVLPIAKSHMKRNRPNASTAIHGPSGLKFLLLA